MDKVERLLAFDFSKGDKESFPWRWCMKKVFIVFKESKLEGGNLFWVRKILIFRFFMQDKIYQYEAYEGYVSS